jgi:hypothetical protein
MASGLRNIERACSFVFSLVYYRYLQLGMRLWTNP